MPEPPDFDQIAQRLTRRVAGTMLPQAIAQLQADIAGQLRLMWNARGATDLATLEEAFAGASPSMKVLDARIRQLDR